MIDRLMDLDKQLFLLLNFNGGEFWDSLFWLISGKLIWAPLYLLILYFIYKQYGWRGMLVAIGVIGIGVGVTEEICNFFKDYGQKLRPTHNPEFEGLISLVNNYRGAPYGTVSAHAANSVLVTTISGLLLGKRWLTVCLIAWSVAVCYSRIYIGAHYPLDIISGAAIGALVGFGAYKLFTLLLSKWEKGNRKQPNR